jgi:hypothetical protein
MAEQIPTQADSEIRTPGPEERLHLVAGEDAAAPRTFVGTRSCPAETDVIRQRKSVTGGLMEGPQAGDAVRPELTATGLAAIVTAPLPTAQTSSACCTNSRRWAKQPSR